MVAFILANILNTRNILVEDMNKSDTERYRLRSMVLIETMAAPNVLALYCAASAVLADAADPAFDAFGPDGTAIPAFHEHAMSLVAAFRPMPRSTLEDLAVACREEMERRGIGINEEIRLEPPTDH